MSVIAAGPQVLCREFYQRDREREQQHLLLSSGWGCSPLLRRRYLRNGCCRNKILRGELRAGTFWSDLTRPAVMEMEPIDDSDQLDQALLRASELSRPIIIDWMAAWCRKCIYLKPKLEKLAVDFDNKVRFYCVDVNKVPQTLVKRGNISKMPTIQLWKDGEMKAEVIGGHKAWLVIEEVREMIEKYI